MGKRISVVTVCWNAERHIEQTIRSVICQNYLDFEYIVVDGLSSDGTMQIVEKYLPVFQKKKIVCRVISEKDKGIYDAMNKAIDMADGDWIIYMNAGDYFFKREVLSDVSEELDDEIGVLYGDVVIHERHKFKYVPAGDIEELKKRDPIHHQACLTRTSFLKKHRFDMNYQIGSDYDLFLRMYLDGVKFKRINYVWAVFLLGGLSHQHFLSFTKEMYRSRIQNGVKDGRNLWVSLILNGAFYRARDLGQLLVPGLLYSKKRGWFSDKNEAIVKN